MSAKAKVRIGRLDSVGGVVAELGRVYRQARHGELDLVDATRLTYVLREIRCALEALDIEARIEVLEAGNSVKQWRGRLEAV